MANDWLELIIHINSFKLITLFLFNLFFISLNVQTTNDKSFNHFYSNRDEYKCSIDMSD